MNALVTYKLTKRLQKDLVNLIFWRGAVICFIYQTIFAVVVCWACASVISKLYQFFSENGVVDVWYHIFVSLPMALISASVLVKLVAQATRDKRGYSMAIKESWPLREDYAIEVEIRIDDNGIGLGKGFKEPKQIEWAEMIFAFASKDFYVFMDKGRGLVGIPKYAIDAALDRYLADQMKTIKKKRRLGVGNRSREGQTPVNMSQ